MKVVVLAIVLAAAVQPVFAKAAHHHRAGTSAAAATPKARTGKADVKSVSRPDSRKSPTPEKNNVIETPAAVAVPRPASPQVKDQGTKTSIKIVAPDQSQSHHTAVPSAPVARDAIGLPVVRHDVTVGKGGESVPSPPAAGGATGKTASFTKPGSQSERPGVGAQHPGPIANGGTANQGRIAGANLIRPGLAPTGLGGPAKAVAGINGTTIRSKH